MMSKMYSIRDKKTEAFNTPWMKPTHGDAERDFYRVVNDPESKVYMFPEDYDLYYLGEFDTNLGKLEGLDSPLHVVQALQLHKPSEEKARKHQTIPDESQTIKSEDC